MPRYEQESIEAILRAIAPYLRTELGNLGYSANSPAGDDLLQEINVRLWKALKARDGDLEYFNSYAKRVVYSVFINEVNGLRQERRLVSAAENERRLKSGAQRDNTPGSEDSRRKAIIESLSALSGAKARVIGLVLQGYALDEIARLNHWSLGKVRASYYRGTRELRNRLAKRGIHDED